MSPKKQRQTSKTSKKKSKSSGKKTSGSSSGSTKPERPGTYIAPTPTTSKDGSKTSKIGTGVLSRASHVSSETPQGTEGLESSSSTSPSKTETLTNGTAKARGKSSKSKSSKNSRRRKPKKVDDAALAFKDELEAANAAKREKHKDLKPHQIINKGGRPSDYDVKFCGLLIDHMADGFSFESFAAIAGCCKDTLYEWAKRHDEFSDAKNKGTQLCRYWWENIGRARAAGMIKSGSDAVWIFNMKNRFKKEWRDRFEHAGDPKAPIQIADSRARLKGILKNKEVREAAKLVAKAMNKELEKK